MNKKCLGCGVILQDTYDYKDGFKLTDVSSLDMTFSRF